MGVAFKDVDGFQALSALGVADSDITALQEAGIKAHVTPAALKLIKDHEVLSSFAVKMQSLKDAIKGELSSISLKMMGSHAQQAVAVALGKPAGVPTVKTASMGAGSKPAASILDKPLSEINPGFKAKPDPAVLDQLAAEITADDIGHSDAAGQASSVVTGLHKADPAPTLSGVTWALFPQSKLTTAPTVKLADATQLYQPVRGSSSGSRYFMVGACDGLRIAARYKGQSLSIRMEGPKLESLMGNIANAGIADKPKGDYVSVHLQCADKTVAAKALGSILAGLGVPMYTPIPVFDLIAGKGS